MKKVLLLLAGLQLIFPSLSRAYTLCYMWEDRFSQGPGSTLPGQASESGPFWESAGPAGPGITVQAGNLAVPHLLAPVGNRIRLTGVNGPGARVALGSNVMAGTLYYSLALRVADLGTLGPNGGTIAAFNNATGSTQMLPAPLAARLLVRSNAGGYQLGLSKSSTNGADFVWAPTTFSTTDVVFVVVAYEFRQEQGTALCSLWINPPATEFGQSSAPAPTVTTSTGADINDIESFVLVQRPGPVHPAVTFIDEVRVATMWPAVTPPGMDFGDAPEGAFPYPTTMMRNGARHGGGPLFFGPGKDLEADGTPTLLADGDDITGVPNDETGIVFGGNWRPGGAAWVDITVSAAGRVDAWADWNQMSGWEGPEKIIASGFAGPGAPVRFNLTLPTGIPIGPTYARFRLSTAGGLPPEGFSIDGEVQDYRVQLLAPLPDLRVVTSVAPATVVDTSNFTHSITVSNGGAGVASGVVVSNGWGFFDIYLEISITSSQGTCSNSASGVVCNLGTLQPGGTAVVGISGRADYARIAAALNAPEMQEVLEATNTVTVTSVEADATPLDNSATAIIALLPLRDFGDAPQPPYPTLLPNGARHAVGALHFGMLIDAEPNGLPVNLDDVTGVADELPDGFAFPAGGLYAGGWSVVNIKVSGPAGYIDLWLDVDGVPGWSGADHVVVAFAHPGGGAIVPVPVAIPPGAVTGIAWARARVHKNPAGLPPNGYGGYGEVVDFQIPILPVTVDLVAVSTPETLTVTEGDPLTLTITVSNKGPSTATSTRLEVHFPAGVTLENLNVSQGTGQMEGTNLVVQVGTLAANGSASVTFTAGTGNIITVGGDEFMWVCWDIYIAPAAIELNPDDNRHHGLIGIVVKRDFGDAPDSYHTLSASGGARHRVKSGWHLGDLVDQDPDGAPGVDSNGDDVGDGNDDEDGVSFTTDIVPGEMATVRVKVVVPMTGHLNAWMDFNKNGSFADAGEHIIIDQIVVTSTTDYNFPVPLGAAGGLSYARFRLSENSGVSYDGFGGIGEVEDYGFNCLYLDWGDAPDSYRTLGSSDGARHLPGAQFYLGSNVDTEADGVPSSDALGDDNAKPLGFDDEDGFSITGLNPGEIATITIVATVPGGQTGYVDCWIDLNRNGVFDDPSEKVIPSLPVGAMPSTHTITYNVPTTASNGISYARIRLSYTGGLGPYGMGWTGEVEDYKVVIAPKIILTPITFDGLNHSVLGGATLSVSSNGLSVSNLASNGQDGVNIELGRVDGWQATLTHQLGASNRAEGSRIEWTVLGEKNGQANQPIIVGRMERTLDCLALYADGGPVGATAFDLEILSNGVVVARTTVDSGRVAALRAPLGTVIGPVGAITIVWQGPTGPNDGWCVWNWRVFGGDGPIAGTAACDSLFNDQGTPVVVSGADSLRIRPTSMTVTVGAFSEVQLRGVNSGDFWLRNEAIGHLGLWQRGVGGARLDTGDTSGPSTLRVRNLGTSGAGGIETLVGGQEYVPAPGNALGQRVVQAWPDDWTMPWLTESNSHVRWTATGRVTGSVNGFQSLGDLSMFRQEQGTIGLTADFDALGAAQSLVDVFDGPVHVGSFTLPGLGKITTATGDVVRITASISDAMVVWTIKWDTRSAFTPSNGASLIGDRLRISAVGSTRIVEGLRSLITRGANVESFALRGFNTAMPQRPRLSPPRLLSGGRHEITFPAEPDVIYDLERSASVNGPWTPIGRLMGTDGTIGTGFLDESISAVGFYRVRGR